MSERKLFGTDGIRGKANVYPMTPEMAMLLGRAVTHHFQTQSKNRRSKPLVIVGKDTRLSCYMVEQAFSAGVCAQGGEVILTGPLPTPGVAFVTKSMRADAGVMISASHNVFSDNGIKIFDNEGFKLPDHVEAELENYIENPDQMPLKVDGDLGNAERLKEVFGRYIVHVKSALNERYDLEGLRVVLDCANGAGYKVTPMMFKELGAEVKTIGVNPNGQNINHKCGSLFPEDAVQTVKEYRADLGVCLDGDGDRVLIVDSKGKIIDGDRLIGIYAKLLVHQGFLKKGDTVVGTVMSNLGLEKYINQLGLKFHRTQVGDRYIMEAMKNFKSVLGGEPSGHVIFGRHSTTGDGSLAALKLIEAMKYFDKPLSKMAEEVSLYPQIVKNVRVKEKPPLENVPKVQASLKKVIEDLGDKGRVILRYSGTEPLARVMVEGEGKEQIRRICDELVTVVDKELGEAR